MNTRDPQHLTADELDSLLVKAGSELITSHLATCAMCRTMVALDTRVVNALAALPILEPAPGFEDRVMARVTIGPRLIAVAAPARSPRELAARRRVVAVTALTGGALAAGFAWAAAHPVDALRWSGPAMQDTGHSLWLSLQAVSANATQQPWFGAFRDTVSSPARAVPALAMMAGAYAVVLTGLRRVMTQPATNAGW